MDKKYLISDLYFVLVYTDAPQFYPCVQSYVFAGMNLFGDELEDTWYFEHLTPSATYRSLSKVPSDERRVRGFTYDDLVEILNIDELKLALEKASARRANHR